VVLKATDSNIQRNSSNSTALLRRSIFSGQWIWADLGVGDLAPGDTGRFRRDSLLRVIGKSEGVTMF
jgi:hypothetical protein